MLVNDALEALKAKFKPKNESEILPISEALGKTLANDVIALLLNLMKKMNLIR